MYVMNYRTIFYVSAVEKYSHLYYFIMKLFKQYKPQNVSLSSNDRSILCEPYKYSREHWKSCVDDKISVKCMKKEHFPVYGSTKNLLEDIKIIACNVIQENRFEDKSSSLEKLKISFPWSSALFSDIEILKSDSQI